jgi:hypothetical protein
LAALKASSDYCDSVYDALTDTTAAQTVKLFGRDFSKFGALYFNVIHNNETYGTMVPYMRLRNIVPPPASRGMPARSSRGRARGGFKVAGAVGAETYESEGGKLFKIEPPTPAAEKK